MFLNFSFLVLLLLFSFLLLSFSFLDAFHDIHIYIYVCICVYSFYFISKRVKKRKLSFIHYRLFRIRYLTFRSLKRSFNERREPPFVCTFMADYTTAALIKRGRTLGIVLVVLRRRDFERNENLYQVKSNERRVL